MVFKIELNMIDWQKREIDLLAIRIYVGFYLLFEGVNHEVKLISFLEGVIITFASL